MTIRRRTVLAALGTAIATTGCLGPGAADDTGTPTGTPDSDPSSRVPDVIADEPCPSFSESDRTICTHTRSDGAQIYLTASTHQYQPAEGNDEVETVTFTLHNESDRIFGLNPYAWSLKRKTPDGWQSVGPDEHIEPWMSVEPGQTYHWVLSHEAHPSPNDDRTIYTSIELDSGLHAFAIDGRLGTESDDEDPKSIECIALFDVAVSVKN